MTKTYSNVTYGKGAKTHTSEALGTQGELGNTKRKKEEKRTPNGAKSQRYQYMVTVPYKGSLGMDPGTEQRRSCR